MARLEPATEGSLQISGRNHKQLCHRRPCRSGNRELKPTFLPTAIKLCPHSVTNFFGKQHGCLCIHHPQKGDLRLAGLLSGRGAGGGAQTRDRWILGGIDGRVDSIPAGALLSQVRALAPDHFVVEWP
ncbi:hypothetical protein PoB_003452300 [Plakobranchus ocellatus]|uniref:Uncharacterized protein n=1 Tax=Plakobranchus ocellatus TaxID=259542 RepID=A0AAV4AL34_9GAST|nr:hypothetical protein PoB_003452300 [Plakobranchus ocellatus]